MSTRLKNYLELKFHPYNKLKIVQELKEELLSDLLEKLDDLKNKGYDDETAYTMTIASLGDISEILESINIKARELQSRVGLDFSKSNLVVADFKDVALRKRRFDFSNLQDADFSNSDLTEASFKCSNLAGAKFIGANLTASIFSASNLANVTFDQADLTGAKLTKSAFKGAHFLDNIFTNTDFSFSDLTDVCFDKQRFIGVTFDYSGLRGTSFRKTTFSQVSFKTEVKKTVFDGAAMDKLTYAILKGYKAKLDNVVII